MTVRRSCVRHFHPRAIEFLTKITRKQTTKSITKKKAGNLVNSKTTLKENIALNAL